MRTAIITILALAVAFGCGSKTEDEGATTGTTGSATTTASAAGTNAGGAADYAAVQAIFTQNCVGCHGAEHPKDHIMLTSYEGVMKGGEDGPIVVAGDPDSSIIMMALRGKGRKQMPPSGPLADDKISVVEAWIKAGAKQ